MISAAKTPPRSPPATRPRKNAGMTPSTPTSTGTRYELIGSGNPGSSGSLPSASRRWPRHAESDRRSAASRAARSCRCRDNPGRRPHRISSPCSSSCAPGAARRSCPSPPGRRTRDRPPLRTAAARAGAPPARADSPRAAPHARASNAPPAARGRSAPAIAAVPKAPPTAPRLRCTIWSAIESADRSSRGSSRTHRTSPITAAISSQRTTRPPTRASRGPPATSRLAAEYPPK